MMQSTVQQGSWQKQWGMLVADAWADEDLKRRLLEDPATVLREYDMDVPYDVELKVVEDTEEVRHLVLPVSPSANLTDEDLGGSADRFSWYSGYSYNCGHCGRCGCGCDRV